MPRYGIRADAHVHPLAAERHALGLQQRALPRALGQRAVGAHDPPPRHVRVGVAEQHRAGEARRARRDVAVGAHEALRASPGPAPAPPRAVLSCLARCAMGRIQSWPSIRRPASSAWRCSRTGSASARCARGRAPGIGAVATQSVVEPAYGPNALDRLADGVDRAAGARRAARRRPAAARPPGRGDLDAARQRRRPHRRGLHRPRRRTSTGEHHSCQANMMAARHRPGRDVGRVRRPPTGALHDRLMAALEAAEAEGGDVRGRQSAAMVVVPAEGEPWRRTRRPARGGPPAPLEELAPAARAPARLRPGRRGATSCWPRAAPTRRASCTAGPRELAPGLRRAAVLGRPRAARRRATWRRASAAVRRAAEDQPELARAARAALAGVRSGG